MHYNYLFLDLGLSRGGHYIPSFKLGWGLLILYNSEYLDNLTARANYLVNTLTFITYKNDKHTFFLSLV